jgi:hypothetical protein
MSATLVSPIPPNTTSPPAPVAEGYNSRLAAPLKGAKLFQFFFKKGHTIRNIVIEGADFDTVRKECEDLSTHFGLRYVSVRPFVFSVEELLKLSDLPNYV